MVEAASEFAEILLEKTRRLRSQQHTQLVYTDYRLVDFGRQYSVCYFIQDGLPHLRDGLISAYIDVSVYEI